MWLVAFLTGYVLGARTEKEDFADVIDAARALRDSEELRELLAVLRTHGGQALRGLADLVERGEVASGAAAGAAVVGSDLVDRVRRMIGER